MNVNIIIPAYNEEKRISQTLLTYCDFFENIKKETGINTNFIVVPNGCTDKTSQIVKEIQAKYNSIKIIDLKQAGKGLAVTTGFHQALQEKSDLIGFVDADMATRPQYFYELIETVRKQNSYDVIFASRYMKESVLIPERPAFKKWGRTLFFNPLIKILLRLNFKDFQCGAKLFRPQVLEKILPNIKMKDWAFDVELLYLAKKNGFVLHEIPTTWYDQQDSKFNAIRSGSKMILSIIKLKLRHSLFRNLFEKKY